MCFPQILYLVQDGASNTRIDFPLDIGQVENNNFFHANIRGASKMCFLRNQSKSITWDLQIS